VRWLLRSSLTYLRVCSLRSSSPPSPRRPLGRLTAVSSPGRPAGRSGRVEPDRRSRGSCYPSGAVLGGELAVPCSLQSAPAGLNPLSRSPSSDAA